MALKRAFRAADMANPLISAGDGQEALELLRAGKVDKPFIVLLDINMPRMNGFEFLDEIRADPELLRSVVFILTTSRSERDVIRAYDHHVAGYIVKSNATQTTKDLATMLDSYRRLVELPTER